MAGLVRVATVPLVIDGDGVNALAGNADLLKTAKSTVLLTPHIGEMSRNSFVYRPCGIPFILTPPSHYFTRLWCPLFLSYLTDNQYTENYEAYPQSIPHLPSMITIFCIDLITWR